ncbi:hypothetical protein IEQ34_010799 [Dendrobium chrysotoxum]|uniref:Uncharacterized protein n=1 Tax=Dendrobium chrysotoxum TaxID=161865 RepID=A0AAV7GTX0_DENCH|nr:hypothetical protein IEQ34_010799 [Dendrobium chrysotoxum]
MAGEEIELRPKKSEKSRSTRAGLTFPVGRIAKLLKDGKYSNRIPINSSNELREGFACTHKHSSQEELKQRQRC